MRTPSLLLISAIVCFAFRPVNATQADDTTITIVDSAPGVTPFISQLHLMASDTTVLRSIQFTVAPRLGSVTRPLSATYSRSYMLDAGYFQEGMPDIFLPVFGLYHSYTNTVTLLYQFEDGSSKEDTTSITTEPFDDTCGYDNPTVLEPRSDDTTLSYDYILVKERCNSFSPAIIDTDSALRWAGPAGIFNYTSAFFNNAVYQAANTILYRFDLDGTVTQLHDYSDIGVTLLHHNIDRGKVGLILDADTADYVESVNVEVDQAGSVLKTWNLAEIISAAMIAGGDDPSQFVYPAPTDWFHNNAATYNRADDSLIVSSRENFVIALDYETGVIKWILGDPTKKWHEFPSLAKYALTVAPDSLPPIGEHAPSITYDNDLLVFDNGAPSLFQSPPGASRAYASPRKYRLDLQAMTAIEVWNYPVGESIFSPYCGSVYEDAPFNYLVDYALVNGVGSENVYAQLLGLNAAGETVFYYQYSTANCNEAFNAVPLHLERTNFPAIGPKALNLSARGTVAIGDDALIGGFIIDGPEDKKIALRVLGPSLASSGLTDTLTDPVLTLYDSSGNVVAMNDDWQSDPSASEIAAAGLAPQDSSESALVQTLSPAVYTAVVTGKDADSGIGIIEAYDLSPESDSKMANLSARGFVGTGDQVLITGFIVGEVANATVIVRALGPSLSTAVSGALNDPELTICDDNGVAIAANDSWQDDFNMLEIDENGLAPINPAEAATLLHPPPGAYSVIVSGADGGSGISLVELYDLD